MGELVRVELDPNEEALPSDLLYLVLPDHLSQLFLEDLAHFLRILAQLLVDDDIEGSDCSLAGQGIAPIS